MGTQIEVLTVGMFGAVGASLAIYLMKVRAWKYAADLWWRSVPDRSEGRL